MSMLLAFAKKVRYNRNKRRAARVFVDVTSIITALWSKNRIARESQY